ncbi:hypothetical protein FVEG_16940 [Fusarium verticillioides 7600]|uniref:Protein-arginine deiminase C-terminal domain-containing protein n=1 Tax=Gibberella moniliformis (strain M3125 / FGSC 7600) TaxID=334819 RepID=W7MWK6_GIBM7|nr:hypothetical protein FVEG_16940 [Fusarium verticillioides 7600]EWG52174.1 hypothetical protein FVEG_16940 [Fusarium verticillioides 7600]
MKGAMGPVHKVKSIVEAGTPKNSLQRQAVDTASQVLALWPGTVNGLVLPDQKVLVPKPWGPVIKKQDIFANAVSEVMIGSLISRGKETFIVAATPGGQ